MDDKFDQVPDSLRLYPQWVVWRSETRANGKPSKVLYDATSVYKASVLDPDTWTKFSLAVSRARNDSSIDGIGFVFTVDDPFCGIDLDVTDLPSDFQTQIFKTCNSYAELSPGGKGCHILTKAAVPHGRNNQKLGIEIYSKGRYFTVTGHRINDKEINDCNTFVLDLWQKIGGKKKYICAGAKEEGICAGTKKEGICAGTKKEGICAGAKEEGICAGAKEEGICAGAKEEGICAGVGEDGLAPAQPYKIKCPAKINDEDLVKGICSSKKNKSYYEWKNESICAGVSWSEAYMSVLAAAALLSSDEAQVKRIILASPLVARAASHGRESRPDRVRRLWSAEYYHAAKQGDLERIDLPYRVWCRQWYPGGNREEYASAIEKTRQVVSRIIESQNKNLFHTIKQNKAKRSKVKVKTRLPVPLIQAGLTHLEHLDLTPPTGVFAEFITEVCARTRNPSPTMAMWAILGFISGTIGRTYVTDEGSGINNFLILSAGTNTGKTQHWSALETIIRIVAPKLLQRIFGGTAASPQILAEEGQKLPSMVLRLPDHGHWLQTVIEARTQAQANVRESLLSIYESANENTSWHIPKSMRSKKDNSKSISEFNMSLVLDTTPQYIGNFDLSDFTDGLISRFIIVIGPEVISDRQAPKLSKEVPRSIKITLDNLVKLSTSHARPINVNEIDAECLGVPNRIRIAHTSEVLEYVDVLDDELIKIVQRIQRGRLRLHYIAVSRVILNAKKVASTVAILQNAAKPIITKEIFDWSLRFVLLSVTQIINMFDAGSIGGEESKQEAAIIDFIERIIDNQPDKPYATLSQIGQYIDRLSCFSKSKLGARTTRKRALDDLFERGVLEKIVIQTKTKPIQAITFAGFYDPETGQFRAEN